MQYTRTPSANTLYYKLYKQRRPGSGEVLSYQLIASPADTFTITTARYTTMLPADLNTYVRKDQRNIIKQYAQRLAVQGNYANIQLVSKTGTVRRRKD